MNESVRFPFQIFPVRIEARLLAVRGRGCDRQSEDVPKSSQCDGQRVSREFGQHPESCQKGKKIVILLFRPIKSR